MHILDNLVVDINQVPAALLDYLLYPFITVIVCLLSVFVVLGNLLVVTAIWHENQLHSVTNYLIASLAAADCLVGALVMPFSIISEIIIGSWTFGATWCDLWHSFDVLASTASIMNLCAISLDRYLAITNPICYPTLMTPQRVALLIVSLWTCSSLISFPAIIWWHAVGQGPLQQLVTPTTVTATSDIMDTLHQQQQQQTTTTTYRCVFTDDTYYLLFSSFVSFYGPLCVMLYAYYRIYKAAVKQTRFLKYGSKHLDNGNDGQDLYLRAHRGGGCGPSPSMLTNPADTSISSSNNAAASSSNKQQQQTNGKVVRMMNNSKTTITATTSNTSTSATTKVLVESPKKTPACQPTATSTTTETEKGKGQILYYDSDKLIQGIVDLTDMHYIDCTNQGGAGVAGGGGGESSSSSTEGPNQHDVKPTNHQVKLNMLDQQIQTSNNHRHNHYHPEVPRHLQLQQQRPNVGKKLAKERKAAKTLGIVVGVFILCWLPFFVVNILVALCGTSCIYKPQILFSIVTWLGWLNSAMNPVIYACWSRDFRRAFRKVLCTWVEFLCYDGSTLAKKLRLKAESSYHNTHEVHLNRTASTMVRSGGGGYRGGGGGAGTSSAAEMSNNFVGAGSSGSGSCARGKSLLSDQ